MKEIPVDRFADRGLGMIVMVVVGVLGFAGCQGMDQGERDADGSLAGKVVCVDPGHGGTAETDHFRVGTAGEREEWINLRVALLLRDMLEERGARVVMTRTEDVSVELKDRALLAVENNADVFVSIHHNATADPEVNFPIVYFHGAASENSAGVALGRLLARNIRDALFDGDTPACLISDRAIFPEKGANVLRNSYGIPGVIGEASFFSNADEEQRLKTAEANRVEAQAYLVTLEEFFAAEIPPIAEVGARVDLPPFAVLEGGERMEEEALAWRRLFLRGSELMKSGDQASLEEALDLFTRSARAFPDSSVAQQCHRYRVALLVLLGREVEAEVEARRAEEYYVAVE